MANSTKHTKRRADSTARRDKVQRIVLRMNAPEPLIVSDGKPVFLPNWLSQLSDAYAVIRANEQRAAAEIERKRLNRARLLRANLVRRGILKLAK